MNPHDPQVDLTTHGITMFKHFVKNIAKLKVCPSHAQRAVGLSSESLSLHFCNTLVTLL
jgi:hypothetical protein